MADKKLDHWRKVRAALYIHCVTVAGYSEDDSLEIVNNVSEKDLEVFSRQLPFEKQIIDGQKSVDRLENLAKIMKIAKEDAFYKKISNGKLRYQASNALLTLLKWFSEQRIVLFSMLILAILVIAVSLLFFVKTLIPELYCSYVHNVSEYQDFHFCYSMRPKISLPL